MEGHGDSKNSASREAHKMLLRGLGGPRLACSVMNQNALCGTSGGTSGIGRRGGRDALQQAGPSSGSQPLDFMRQLGYGKAVTSLGRFPE